MSNDTYNVAYLPAAGVSTEAKEALARAGSKRRVHLTVYLALAALAIAALVAAGLVAAERIDDRMLLPVSTQVTAAARDVVYVTGIACLLSGAVLWLIHHFYFGALHSRASILWLRKFHRRDATHRLFRRRLAKLTPATFAVTLRDSQVTGSLEEGFRRATPILVLFTLFAFAVVASWEVINGYCTSSDHQCRAIDVIWLEPLTQENEWFFDEARPMAIAGALMIVSGIVLALLVASLYLIGPLFGDVRGNQAEANLSWFDRLLANGSAALTYVLRTSDAHWQETVAHILRRSGLTIYDLTFPTKHIEFELSLLKELDGRVVFMSAASIDNPLKAADAFRAFIVSHAPPPLTEALQFHSVDRKELFRILRAQAEAAL